MSELVLATMLRLVSTAPAHILSFGRVKMYRALAALLLVFITTAVSNHMQCAHGVWEVDHCACEYNYVGERCEKKMHCSSFMRHPNETCLECQIGAKGEVPQKRWEGPYCERIVCNPEYGTPTNDSLMCECTEPFTGEHCEILTTENVYIYYNRRMAEWGPIGALSLIPMILFLMICNFFAKRRHIKRVERALGGDQLFYDDADSLIIPDLLGSYDDP